jgi:HKD family nuclease
MLTFIHNKSDTDNHLTAISGFLADAENAFIFSGHLKAGGVELLSDALKQAVARGARIIVYSNVGDGDTQPRAISALKKLGVEHILVKDFFLHTKLYLFESGENFAAITGSANVTRNALTTNEEFSSVVTGRKEDDQHRDLSAYAAYLDARCRSARAPASAKTRRGKCPKTTSGTVAT